MRKTYVKDSLTDSLLTEPAAKNALEEADGEEAFPALKPGRILDASRELLGERVHGSPDQYPDPGLLLAWVAQVYDQRERLRKPARVAYANLKARRPPERAYVEDPCGFLPDWFLGRIGLAPPEETRRVFEDPGDIRNPDHGEIRCRSEPFLNPSGLKADPSLELMANRLGTKTAGQAWEAAMEQLRLELPVGVFRAYLLDTRLERYEAEGGVFVVEAPDAERREWLEEHLAGKLERMMLGICDREVTVRVDSK